jgi:hypothetical protein
MIVTKKYILTALIICMTGVSALIAQPSITDLADQVNRVNQERLSTIETLELTVQTITGDTADPETLNRYVKDVRNGTAVLVPDTESDQMMTNQEYIEGVFDGTFENLIRGAESIENDQLNGRAAYKLTITDPQLLNEYEDGMSGDDYAGPDIQQADLWIDRELLVPVQMVYSMGGDFSVEVLMENYEMHSGLPIAKKMTIDIKGVSSMFSEKDREEARRAMEQLRNQLAQIPEAQREMIESRMAGQIEQFERILESGNMSATTVNVRNVRVNQ